MGMTTDIISNFKNKVLIATHQLDGSYFEGAIVLICAHTEDSGAMGLVINRPVDMVKFTDVTDSLEITPKIPKVKHPQVLSGGPVDVDRGFVLHSAEYDLETTIHLDMEHSLTASARIIEDIAHSKGPDLFDLCLGYAGWLPNQLEQEIAENAWLVSSVNMSDLFHIKHANRYQFCLQNLGISHTSGSLHAFGNA